MDKRRAVRTMALGAAGLVIAASGCERQDPHTRSIAEARNTMTASASGGSAAAPRGTLSTQYASVLTTARDDGASDAEKSILASIAAGALAGQGDLASEEFRAAGRALLAATTAAKAKLGLYVEQRALEAALAGYDPQGDIARFDELLKERDKELATARQRLATHEAKVADLRARAKQDADRAASMMSALGGLRQQLEQASATDRPALAATLNTARREAESVMKASELTSAQADSIAPVSAELALDVARVERQIASLGEAKERARALAASRAEQSAIAGRAAAQAATDAAEAMNAVRAVLGERVKPTFEAALAKLSQAAGKFGQSRGGPDQKLLAVANGAAAQAIGSLQREYAESLGRVALLFEQASKATPAIAGASELAADAAALGGERTQALEAALAQYEKAKSAFEGAGGSGDVKARLEVLARKVGETYIRLGGAPPEEPAAEQPADAPDAPVEEADAPAADAPPADPPADATTPHD